MLRCASLSVVESDAEWDRRVVVADLRYQALVRCARDHFTHRKKGSAEGAIGIASGRRLGKKFLVGLVQVEVATEKRVDLDSGIHIDRVGVRRVLRLRSHVGRSTDVDHAAWRSTALSRTPDSRFGRFGCPRAAPSLRSTPRRSDTGRSYRG